MDEEGKSAGSTYVQAPYPSLYWLRTLALAAKKAAPMLQVALGHTT